MRWRISGKNWEGRSWVLSAGAIVLAKETDAIWPQPNPLDGTVASRNHDYNNPTSDHRPKPYSGPGVVRALDVGENVQGEVDELAERLRALKDNRLSYFLHDNRIFSSYPRPNRPAWEWGPLNIGHTGHGHISFEERADHDTRPWGLREDDMASPGQKLMVDLAFNLFPAEVQGDPNVWKALDENDPQWTQDFAPALSRGAQNLFLKVQALEKHKHPSSGLGETEVKALIANSKVVPPAT